MGLLGILVGAVAATGVLWFSCSYLETASHRLALRYGVPDIVKGSLITAVSSSMPELATAVLAPLHGDFELGLSAIIGSAIYNILVIPAMSVFARGRALTANRALVFREAQFYLVAVIMLMLVLCLSVIYNGSHVPTEAGVPITGQLTTGLALLPLGLYGIYLFIQWEEVREHRVETTLRLDINPWKEWFVLVGCIALIVGGVELLLQCAMALGELMNTPTFLWGLTVVAAATSLPDTLISVRAAAANRTDSSISNVLGSNVFDLLVAVPIGVLLVGTITVNFSEAIPMIGFLMIATIVMLVFMRHDMRLTRQEAGWMLFMYVAFGVWIAAEAFGFVNILGIPR